MKRRDVEAAARSIAEPLAESRGLTLVDVEFVKESGEYHLRVFVDKPGGVNVDDCQILSKELGRQMDLTGTIEGNYYMEVSSPGLERPLKKDEDYDTFKGRLVEVKTFAALDGKKNFTGVLLGLQEGCVLLQVGGEQEIKIPREKVASAKLALEF